MKNLKYVSAMPSALIAAGLFAFILAGDATAAGTGICVTPDGRNVPCSAPPSQTQPNYSPPSYDWQAEQRRLEELERNRREQAEAEQRRRDEERQKKFFAGKKKALNQLKARSGDPSGDPLPLKSGTPTLGLKRTPNPTSKLKTGTASPRLKYPEFSKGAKDSAPVDFTQDDLKHAAAAGRSEDKRRLVDLSDAARLQRTFRMKAVPSPSGYKSKSEREALAAALSDEQLEKAIRNTRRALTRLKDDMLRDVKTLDTLLEDAQQAESDALLASFSLLTAGAIDSFPESIKGKPQYAQMLRDLKLLTNRAKSLIDHKGAYDESKKTKSYKAMVRSFITDGYSILQTYQDAFLDGGVEIIGKGGKGKWKSGPHWAALASFAVDYSEAAMRWGLARSQMQMVFDNLDKPNGKAKAEESLSRLQKDLVLERNRRKKHKG